MEKYVCMVIAIGLSSCNPSAEDKASNTNEFLASLSYLCGQTYMGEVVSDDPQDEDWRKEVLTLGPITCSEGRVIAMPLAVGEDTSRTWFLIPHEVGIEFRHQHLLKNGDIDPVSDYGGFAENLHLDKLTWRVDFPADEKTIEIFEANGLGVSTTNIWSFEYEAGYQLNYELNRKNRHFRAEFDISSAP